MRFYIASRQQQTALTFAERSSAVRPVTDFLLKILGKSQQVIHVRRGQSDPHSGSCTEPRSPFVRVDRLPPCFFKRESTAFRSRSQAFS